MRVPTRLTLRWLAVTVVVVAVSGVWTFAGNTLSGYVLWILVVAAFGNTWLVRYLASRQLGPHPHQLLITRSEIWTPVYRLALGDIEAVYITGKPKLRWLWVETVRRSAVDMSRGSRYLRFLAFVGARLHRRRGFRVFEAHLDRSLEAFVDDLERQAGRRLLKDESKRLNRAVDRSHEGSGQVGG
jgi:hypothetical protein